MRTIKVSVSFGVGRTEAGRIHRDSVSITEHGGSMRPEMYQCLDSNAPIQWCANTGGDIRRFRTS